MAVLGYGEAGSDFVEGLLERGATVRVYDPVANTPADIETAPSEAEAVMGADLVLSVNSASAAVDAFLAALPRLAPGTIWADMNTAAPALKQELADLAARHGVLFADVAIMAPVPGNGIEVPMRVSGVAADRVAETLAQFGTPIEIEPGPAGAAAQRKLLRSVFFKGMSAAVVEALAAARAAGCEDWLRENIVAEFVAAGEHTVDRLVVGSVQHAKRRAEEMAAAADMLESLGVAPHVAGASRDVLRGLLAAR
ncbi:MAG: NAD(P)-binding domain-containing protein [Actinomycetota bacterium]|nr:NAD(P)-binding domain-containing protein [Actinomycetota bacterium]